MNSDLGLPSSSSPRRHHHLHHHPLPPRLSHAAKALATGPMLTLAATLKRPTATRKGAGVMGFPAPSLPGTRGQLRTSVLVCGDLRGPAQTDPTSPVRLPQSPRQQTPNHSPEGSDPICGTSRSLPRPWACCCQRVTIEDREIDRQGLGQKVEPQVREPGREVEWE